MPTTSRGYPYPSIDEPPAGPPQIQALADAVNADVGAIAASLTKTTGTISYGTNWSDISGEPSAVEKVAGIATLYLGAVKSAASTAGETICTLPVGFRPARKVRLTGNNAGASRGVTISTAGLVTNDVAQASGALSAIVGTVSFSVA